MIPIVFECPDCGTKKIYKKAPKSVRCPKCRGVYEVENRMMLNICRTALEGVFEEVSGEKGAGET